MDKNVFNIFFIICVLFICLIFPIKAFSQNDPLNVRLTNAAWRAFGAKDFNGAIKNAEECIDEFQPAALREQEQLEKDETPAFPVGKVDKETEKTLLRRGLLNDVATCWFIKGRSLEKLGRTQEALNAFRQAEKYTYARTWDDQGKVFWSPAEGAKDRIRFLMKQLPPDKQ